MPQRALAALKANTEGLTAILSLGLITYAGGAASESAIPGAGSGAAPYIAQGAFTVFGLLVIYGVKYFIKRLDVQTAKDAQTSADSVVVIRELRQLVVDKDKHCESELAALRREHERKEEIARADRHKYRGRTTMCMSRLYLLCEQGKITRDEATIRFEEVEDLNPLADLTEHDAHRADGRARLSGEIHLTGKPDS